MASSEGTADIAGRGRLRRPERQLVEGANRRSRPGTDIRRPDLLPAKRPVRLAAGRRKEARTMGACLQAVVWIELPRALRSHD